MTGMVVENEQCLLSCLVAHQCNAQVKFALLLSRETDQPLGMEPSL